MQSTVFYEVTDPMWPQVQRRVDILETVISQLAEKAPRFVEFIFDEIRDPTPEEGSGSQIVPSDAIQICREVRALVHETQDALDGQREASHADAAF